jgi:hypothetical protein
MASSDRSTAKPSSFEEVSDQARLIAVSETAVAVREVGAVGGGGGESVVAEAWFE